MFNVSFDITYRSLNPKLLWREAMRGSAKDGSYFFPVQNNKCTCKVESARTVPLLLWSKRWKKSERFLDKTGKHKRQSKNLNRPHNNQLEFLLKKKIQFMDGQRKETMQRPLDFKGKPIRILWDSQLRVSSLSMQDSASCVSQKEFYMEVIHLPCSS